MEWIIFAFMLLLFPFAFIKFLLENPGFALFIFAIFLIEGLVGLFFSD